MSPSQLALFALMSGAVFWFVMALSSDPGPAARNASGVLPPLDAAVIARVGAAKGAPSVQEGGKESPWTDVGLSYELKAGATIETDFGEEVRLEFANGSQIELGAGSLLEIAVEPDGTPLLRLQRGRLRGHVEGGSVAFQTPFGGGLQLTPDPGERVQVSLGDRPSPVIGLSPAPWISDDWGLVDPGSLPPMLYRGGLRQPGSVPVIPEPRGIVLLVLGGAIGVGAMKRRRRKLQVG